MKSHQISIMVTLTVLLNFSSTTTWANEKTAIIAGGAGAGAAAVIGGALWYKLSKRLELKFKFDNGKLISDDEILKNFEDTLYNKEFSQDVVDVIVSKIDKDILEFNNLSKKVDFKYLFTKNNSIVTMKTEIKVNGIIKKELTDNLQNEPLININKNKIPNFSTTGKIGPTVSDELPEEYGLDKLEYGDLASKMKYEDLDPELNFPNNIESEGMISLDELLIES